MIAASRYGQPARRGDRVIAIILVALVHVGLALALLNGFTVRIDPHAESTIQLIDVRLPPAPPPPPPPPPPKQPQKARREAAAKAVVAPKGGTKAPEKVKRAAPVVPQPKVVLPVPKVASGGGSAGRGGPSAGFGAGGGQGGNGDGDGDGGTDLYQIAGGIGPQDYPPALRDRGIGGRVSVTFTVAPSGRVTNCAVTRSSGVPQLDQLTCRLIQQRFVYRPSTDRLGRPIVGYVDHDQSWIPHARD